MWTEVVTSVQKIKPIVVIGSMSESEKNTDKEALLAKIKLLEKQLADAQLQVEGYDLLLDLAEQQYKITIRKKSDSK